MSAGSSSFMRRSRRAGGDVRADVEVRHLRERVDAGVGAAGAVQLELAHPGRVTRTARSISPATVRAFF